MTLGNRIKQARKRLEMSQGVLGRAIGVDQSSVAGWENDRARPRRQRLGVLSEVLQVTAIWLEYGCVDSGPIPLVASLGDGGRIFSQGHENGCRPTRELGKLGGLVAIRVETTDLMPAYYPGDLLIGRCHDPDSHNLEERNDTVLGFNDGRALLLRSGAWPGSESRFIAIGRDVIWCLPVEWIRRAGSQGDQPYSHSIVPGGLDVTS
jgi:transcriptional regulator with XRE-family HTH domain